jgi:hypothetical protein
VLRRDYLDTVSTNHRADHTLIVRSERARDDAL